MIGAVSRVTGRLAAACLVSFLAVGAGQLSAQQTPASAPVDNGSANGASAAPPAAGLAGAQSALANADGKAPGSTAAAADPSLTVPAGTKVLLSVQSAVNTKTARPGDGIYLVSTFPVIVGTKVLIPPGVYVQGIVDEVTRPGRVKGRAKLLMHFTTMIFPNGQVVPIPGGVNNLPGSDGPKVNNKEGEIEQAGSKGKDAGTIAKGGLAGAGLGTIAGSAAGGPLAGAAYGGLAGAAAAGIYTLFTRGDDIMIPQNSSVEMVLQRPLTLEASQLAGINDVQGRPQYVPSASQQRPLPKPHMVMTCPAGSLGCN